MRSTFLFLFLYAIVPGNILAQDDSGFMYGKVVTQNGNSYVGQIRWGDEEIFWNDIFNSVKTYNNTNTSTTKLKKESVSETEESGSRWTILKIWDDAYTGQVHQFTCRFGDIKEIHPLSNENTAIVFKDNHKTIVRGGSNDIGAEIRVTDFELGNVHLSWNKVKTIEFFDAPAYISNKPGNPLYGKVKTESGDFEGFVQWDYHERIDTDILDGYYNRNKLQIKFKDIKCISKSGCQAIVTHKNGNRFQLSGTNDVDCSNRGIIVTVPDIGKIEVPWSVFKSLCLEDTNAGSGEPYRSYAKPKMLYGKVKTLDGNTKRGVIVFDNDESWDYEHLEGLLNGIKYIIPFRNISAISPKNINHSSVTLKNGNKLLLGELQDVSSKNEGVKIFREYENTPVSFSWMQIDEIIFE